MMKLMAIALAALALLTTAAQAQRLVPQVAESYEICLDTFTHLRGAPTPIHVVIAVGPKRSGTDEAACVWGGGATPRQAHDNAHADCRTAYKYCLNFADSQGYYPAIRDINTAGGTLTPELYQKVRTALLREGRNSQGGKFSGKSDRGVASPSQQGGGQTSGTAPATGLADPRNGLAIEAKGNLTRCLTGVYDLDIEGLGYNRNAFYDSFEVDGNLVFRNGCNQMLTLWVCYADEWQVYNCSFGPDAAPGEQTISFSSIVGDRFFYLACPNGENACNKAGHNWYNKSKGKPRGSDLRQVR